MMQLIFNVLSIIFILWMSFRWDPSKFRDSMIKVFLFLLAVLGIILVINELNILS